MRESIAYGLGVALRGGATPWLLGMRWAERRRSGTPDLGARVAAKAALDEMFLATELASGAVLPTRDRDRARREINRALALYQSRGWLDAPARFHPRPPAVEAFSFRDRRSALGRYRHLQFESGYVPHPGEPGRKRWIARDANHTAHTWLLQHPGPPRPWLVCLPGYRMGVPSIDFVGFQARWLHEALGINLAFPVPAFHGPRRTGWRAGDGFLSGDFLDTLHAVAQGVWDVRRLIGWLRRRGNPPVGLYGISLGCCTAGVLAGLVDDLACAIAGIPATDPAQLLRHHLPDPLLRRVERRGAQPFARIGRLMRVVSPLAITPRVPRRRRFLCAGRADRLAPPEQARALWEHWGRPRLDWYDGGHVSFLWEPEVRQLLADALRESGLTPG